MRRSCEETAKDNFATPLSLSVVLEPYTSLEKRNFGADGALYELQLKGSPAKTFLYLYPAEANADMSPSSDAVQTSCALSTIPQFPTVSDFGLLFPGQKADKKTPMNPYVFFDFFKGHLMSQDNVSKWGWSKMVTFCFRLVQALRAATLKIPDYVNGNLTPDNVFMLDDAHAQDSILSIVPERTVQLRGASIRIVDFGLRPDVRVPDGLPTGLLQFCGKYVGMDKAMHLLREVDEFARGNNLEATQDLRTINLYIALFQCIKKRSMKIDTTVLMTGDWIRDLAENPLFRVIETKDPPSAIETVVFADGMVGGEPLLDSTDVAHREAESMFANLLPFFGIGLPSDLVRESLRVLSQQYQRQVGSVNREWTAHIAFQVKPGTWPLEDSSVSTSAKSAVDVAEVIVTASRGHVGVRFLPEGGLSFAFPIESLDGIQEAQDLRAMVPTSQKSVTIVPSSMKLQFESKAAYEIEAMLAVDSNDVRRPIRLRGRSDKEVNAALAVQDLLPKHNRMLRTLLDGGAIQSDAIVSFETAQNGHFRVNRKILARRLFL